MGRTLAAVDIGSNTVHMLVADASPREIVRIADQSEWLGLGEVVAREGSIPSALQLQLVETLQTFKQQACDADAEGIYVFATEAIRRAKNTKAVLENIKELTGIKVDIVTPRREAELGLRGTLIDVDAASFLLVDVGGGSAQIAQCKRKRILGEESYPLGTGTLIAKLALTYPCDYPHIKRMARTLSQELSRSELFDNVSLVAGTGGVVRGLWRALHPDGDRRLHIEELEYLIWSTRQLPPEVIVERFNVKPKRALTLLPGALLYKQVLEKAGKDFLTVSRYGVREGAVMEMLEGKVGVWPV